MSRRETTDERIARMEQESRDRMERERPMREASDSLRAIIGEAAFTALDEYLDARFGDKP